MTAHGLAVLFPELDPLLDPIRQGRDPSAAQGLGAHVTVLFPFQAPNPPARRALAAICAKTPVFEVTFPQLGRFPKVLYLDPDPAAPFIDLTQAVWHAFPSCPPYGGVFDGIVPHLTLAQGTEARDLTPDLPLPLFARATCVSHLTLEDSLWQEVDRLPFDPG